MDDLMAWLLTQLDQDERDIDESRALSQDELHWSMPDWLHRGRLLAEVAAKRRILDEHEVYDNGVGKPDSRYCGCCFHDRYYNADVIISPVWCKTVRLLALPYADRPGYLDEWRPPGVTRTATEDH